METNIYLAEKRPPLYLIVLMALIAVVLALFVHPAIFVISSLCLTIGLLFLRKPFFVLLFLVFSRAGIDKFARQYRLLEDTSLSINLLGILNIALIFLVIFYFLFMKKKIPNQPFWLTFSAFLYIAIITIFISNNRVLSLRGLMQVGSYLAIYLLLVNQLKHPKDLHKLRFAIITSTIIPVVFGIYQFFTGTGNTEISPGINRIMGTFFHPSAFGMYLIILWPLLFFSVVSGKKKISATFFDNFVTIRHILLIYDIHPYCMVGIHSQRSWGSLYLSKIPIDDFNWDDWCISRHNKLATNHGSI